MLYAWQNVDQLEASAIITPANSRSYTGVRYFLSKVMRRDYLWQQYIVNRRLSFHKRVVLCLLESVQQDESGANEINEYL